MFAFRLELPSPSRQQRYLPVPMRLNLITLLLGLLLSIAINNNLVSAVATGFSYSSKLILMDQNAARNLSLPIHNNSFDYAGPNADGSVDDIRGDGGSPFLQIDSASVTAAAASGTGTSS